jgi:hypothetical protein
MSYKLNFENYSKPLFISMLEFTPDYSKCIDERKELHHNLCKHMKKNDIIICNLRNKPCESWEGYKHEC